MRNRIIEKNDSVVLSWQKGKYISRDGVLTEIISHKGIFYRVKIVGKKEVTYLVTDGKNWAHGETLKEAKEDLTYKITDRRKEDYEGKNLDDVLTHEEAVKCYRVITGACSQGTKHFVTQILNGARKEKYAISEIISLTEGQYGNETFSKFFQKTTKK